MKAPQHLWDWASLQAQSHKTPLPQLGAATGLPCGKVSPGKMKQPADLLVQEFNKKFSFWAPLPVNSKSFPAFFPLCRMSFFSINIWEQFTCLFLPPARSQWNVLPPRHRSLAWLDCCCVRNRKIIMLPFTFPHEFRCNSLLSFPFCPLNSPVSALKEELF